MCNNVQILGDSYIGPRMSEFRAPAADAPPLILGLEPCGDPRVGSGLSISMSSMRKWRLRAEGVRLAGKLSGDHHINYLSAPVISKIKEERMGIFVFFLFCGVAEWAWGALPSQAASWDPGLLSLASVHDGSSIHLPHFTNT